MESIVLEEKIVQDVMEMKLLDSTNVLEINSVKLDRSNLNLKEEEDLDIID